MTTPLCISTWIDHHRFGFGRRDFLVAKTGWKHVTILALGDLTPVHLSRKEFDALMASKATRQIEYKPTRLKRRIKTNMAIYRVETNLIADTLKSISTRKG